MTFNRKVDIEDSSHIKYVWYSTEDNAMLVGFQSGDDYIHDQVPVQVFARLITAESVGVCYNELVKGMFTYRKVEKSG